MPCQKKSTIQTCQPQQTDPLRTIFTLGSLLPAGLHSSKDMTKAKLRIISTYANRPRNSRRINTSILKNLNIPGINTYGESFSTSANLDVARRAKSCSRSLSLGAPLVDGRKVNLNVMRTYTNRDHNSCRISRSILQDLKPLRMNSCYAFPREQNKAVTANMRET